ncbi:MAG: hypothetical protein R3C29_03080 [Dehalococcoidia bacterium]
MMAGLVSAVMGFTQMIIATAYGIGFNALVGTGAKDHDGCHRRGIVDGLIPRGLPRLRS